MLIEISLLIVIKILVFLFNELILAGFCLTPITDKAMSKGQLITFIILSAINFVLVFDIINIKFVS